LNERSGNTKNVDSREYIREIHYLVSVTDVCVHIGGSHGLRHAHICENRIEMGSKVIMPWGYAKLTLSSAHISLSTIVRALAQDFPKLNLHGYI
jgi:hypothetical protein